MKPVRHRLPAGIAGAVLALVLAVPALAHAELESSNPADGAELETGPTTIQLRFSEGLSASRSSFRLLGPAGDVDTGSAAKDGAPLMGLEGPALPPGEYTIKWTAVAEDGHVERGTLSFTVLLPASAPASPAAGQTGSATTAPPSSGPAASGSAAPSAVLASDAPAGGSPTGEVPAGVTPSPDPLAPSDAAAASGSDVLLPIAAALVLVGVVGTLVVRRSRGA